MLSLLLLRHAKSSWDDPALAVLTFEAPGWPKIARGGGRLALFMTPKRLP